MKKITAIFLFLFATTLVAIITLIERIFWDIPKTFIVASYKATLCALPQWMRQELNLFCIHGIKQNSAYLNRLKLSEFLKNDIEYISNYADKNTVDMIDRINYNFDPATYDFINSQNISPTFCGNLAYLAINSPKEAVRENAFNFLYWLKENHVGKQTL